MLTSTRRYRVAVLTSSKHHPLLQPGLLVSFCTPPVRLKRS